MVSCTSDSESENLNNDMKATSELTAKDIAKYHNIAVELYQNSSYKKKSGKEDVLEIQNAVSKLLKENNPELFQNNNLDIVMQKSFLNQKFVKAENSFDFENFLSESLNQLVENNEISADFANKIKMITTADDDYSQRVVLLNEIQTTSLTNRELEFLNIYKETLVASNEYWNNDQDIQTKRVSCSSGVIAGDAVGAALGLWGGPLLSIIQGAVVSIAINEDC
jgi:hypothetical protein